MTSEHLMALTYDIFEDITTTEIRSISDISNTVIFDDFNIEIKVLIDRVNTRAKFSHIMIDNHPNRCAICVKIISQLSSILREPYHFKLKCEQIRENAVKYKPEFRKSKKKCKYYSAALC
jgi:hypothetical protein